MAKAREDKNGTWKDTRHRSIDQETQRASGAGTLEEYQSSDSKKTAILGRATGRLDNMRKKGD